MSWMHITFDFIFSLWDRKQPNSFRRRTPKGNTGDQSIY